MKLNHLVWLAILLNCGISAEAQHIQGLKQSVVACGADRTDAYFPILTGKRIGVVANPTSRVGSLHLVDTLVRSGMQVEKVFAPEHGFRGNEEAGAVFEDGKDVVTGIPVISLYGKHKKPTAGDLAGLDWVVFDIQDVGVRFYTYISTLHLVMEACAQEGRRLMVLDRPNPNGFYVDGPILDTAYRSFVGMHPVPVVHGMTIGEYAKMINGEHWLEGGIQCDLTVIPCSGWDHQTEYVLPVKPSPNLPNQTSVYLYPSVCFFEGTVVSLGRGTDFPFQVYGHPDLPGDFHFTPRSIPGVSVHPPLENQKCSGHDLRIDGIEKISCNHGLVLEWLIDAYQKTGKGALFFIGYFDTLAGGPVLRTQIMQGLSPEKIRSGWQPGLLRYQEMRAKYLLY